MELVMTLPVLGILLLGILEFTLLFFARGTVVEASRLGARRATLPGVTTEEIYHDVQLALGPRMAPVAEIDVQDAARSGEPVAVAVRVPMAAASPDLLWPVGFGLEGKHLLCTTHMVKE
jgi:hypothetical protein